MDELQPIDENEFVYRRVHADFFDGSLLISVKSSAFRPSKNDITGLSVFRACFASPLDTLPPDAGKAKAYYVARLAVRDLAKLGLTVRAEPVSGGPPGHCVIPELTWQGYQGQKQHWKPILLELAKLASADIVHRPDS